MKSPLVILVWSLPDEPDFARAIAERYDPFWIVPLRYQALQAAGDIFPEENILRPGSLVSAGARREIYDRTIDRVNGLWARLHDLPSEPWLGSIQYYMAIYVFYAADYWTELIKQLPVKESECIRHYEPFSRIFFNGFSLAEVDMLTAVLDLKQAGVRQVTRRKKAAAVLGGWCNRWADKLLTTGSRTLPPQGRDLFCGLQSTDWLAQKKLIQEMVKSGHNNFRWMVPARDRLTKMADEITGTPESEPLDRISDTYDLDECGYYCDREWKHSRLGSLSDLHITSRLKQEIDAVIDDPAVKKLAAPAAALIARQNPDLRVRYAAVDRIMNAYNPQTVIVNSTIDEPAYISAWTRTNKRNLIVLPHGVHSVIDYHFHWDAPKVGVIGAYTDKCVSGMNGKNQERFITGGMHVAALGQRAAEIVREARSGQSEYPRRVLFLLANNYGFNFPDSVDELESDLESLTRALAPIGWRVALRCHPRSMDAEACRHMIKILSDKGCRVEWSEGRDSLSADLAASGLAMTRTWDGAAVTALYAGVPLAGWLPRPIHKHADHLLRKLPLCVSTSEEIKAIAEKISSESSAVQNIFSEQRNLLEQFVDRPFEPPFDAAADYCLKEFSGA